MKVIAWWIACAAAGVVVVGLLLSTPWLPVATPSSARALAGGVADLAHRLVASLPQQVPDGALVIVPPEIDSPGRVDPGAAREWSESLTLALERRRPELRVAARDRLEAILREQKLGASAYADPASAAAVGRLVAARLVLVSAIHELRREGPWLLADASLQLIDVETGLSLWSRRMNARGLLPPIRVGMALCMAALALGAVTAAAGRWRRRRDANRVRARTRLERAADAALLAASDARSRAAADSPPEAARIQEAWRRFETRLDAARHTLGDRARPTDTLAAASALDQLASDCRAASADALPDLLGSWAAA